MESILSKFSKTVKEAFTQQEGRIITKEIYSYMKDNPMPRVIKKIDSSNYQVTFNICKYFSNALPIVAKSSTVLKFRQFDFSMLGLNS